MDIKRKCEVYNCISEDNSFKQKDFELKNVLESSQEVAKEELIKDLLQAHFNKNYSIDYNKYISNENHKNYTITMIKRSYFTTYDNKYNKYIYKIVYSGEDIKQLIQSIF